MIKYDKLWETMEKKGITKYTLHKEYHLSKSLIHRLQNNEGINMNTINTLCNILDCDIQDIATHHPEGLSQEPTARSDGKNAKKQD